MKYLLVKAEIEYSIMKTAQFLDTSACYNERERAGKKHHVTICDALQMLFEGHALFAFSFRFFRFYACLTALTKVKLYTCVILSTENLLGSGWRFQGQDKPSFTGDTQ